MTGLAPGATIGILGGGQLGRMLALAAARLGLTCHIFAPETACPAFQVAAAHTTAGYGDRAALRAFAGAVDAITYEFENVPADCVRFLETLKPVRPGSKALEVAQDRLREKHLARSLGAMTAEFASVTSLDELMRGLRAIGVPAVLKTCRFGYDGKGQVKLKTLEEAPAAFAAMAGQPAILEQFADFRIEVSVVAARSADGQFAAFDLTENLHRDHILHTATVPAQVSAATRTAALAIAGRIGAALDYTGVFAVEFFVCGSGDCERLLVNEIAPRVHNSGHWTMDACLTSQFEQHIRAVAGWPLGDPARHSDAVMTNLIGAEALDWAAIAAAPGAALHLYGKAEARPGRKMGHVNRITPRQP